MSVYFVTPGTNGGSYKSQYFIKTGGGQGFHNLAFSFQTVLRFYEEIRKNKKDVLNICEWCYT